MLLCRYDLERAGRTTGACNHLRYHRSRRGRATGEPIEVECYAGSRGEQTPRRLRFADGRVEDVDVVRRWLTPEARGFELRACGGRRYAVLQSPATHAWELVEQSR